MEALKRCSISAFSLWLSVLASVGMVWFDTTFAQYTAFTLWEKVAKVWLWIGGTVGAVALFAFLILSIITLFIPAEETFRKIFE